MNLKRIAFEGEWKIDVVDRDEEGMLNVEVAYWGTNEEPSYFKSIRSSWKVDLDNGIAFETSLAIFGFIFKVDNPEDKPENWEVSIKDPEKLCVNTPLNPDYCLFTFEAAKKVFLTVVPLWRS